MSRAPKPSLWGMAFIIALLAFLIWLGPVNTKKQLELEEITVEGVDCIKPLKELTETQFEICREIQNSTRS